MSYLTRLFLAALVILIMPGTPVLCEALFHHHAHDEGVPVETHGDAHHHDEAEGADGHSHHSQQEDTCCSRLLPAYYLQAWRYEREGPARGLIHTPPTHVDFLCPAIVGGTLSQKNIALYKDLCRGPTLSIPLYDLLDTYRI
jgi:hypothetical protein